MLFKAYLHRWLSSVELRISMPNIHHSSISRSRQHLAKSSALLSSVSDLKGGPMREGERLLLSSRWWAVDQHAVLVWKSSSNMVEVAVRDPLLRFSLRDT